jgi:hypothetical protein
MATEFRPPDRSQHVRPERVKRRTSRQKRERQTRDEEYLALRDIYLEENPTCVNCALQASEVHHIISGTAGRARSLLNPNTWLGVCNGCHRLVEKMSVLRQFTLKCEDVCRTIERLRK